jgi:hypothetical protein
MPSLFFIRWFGSPTSQPCQRSLSPRWTWPRDGSRLPGDENQVRRNKIQAGRNESQAECNKIQAQRNKIQISYRFNSSAKSKVFQMIMTIGSFFCSAQ